MSAPSRHSLLSPIPPGDRIPFPQKIGFSLGYGVDYLAAGLTTGVLWMPYFNIGMGLNPALLGAILMALRAWEAFSDPVMGNLSDNTRTRWGRRRPYIAVGALGMALAYPFLWRPPAGLGSSGVAAYLLVLGLIFFGFFTIWSMPFYSLQMELTPNYDERTRLGAWVALVGKLTYLGGGWVMAFISASWFADSMTGKPDMVHGMKVCSWFLAGLILILGMMPALFVRERYYESATERQPRDPFWKSMSESARCRPLWHLIGLSFLLVLGVAASNGLGQYVNIYVVNGGHLDRAAAILGWKGVVVMTAGILGIPVWTWLGERFDKKSIVAAMLAGSMLGHLLNLVCLRPGMPYLLLVPAAFEAGALSALWLFIPSMKADVADYDEVDTGRRREGSLNAFHSWFGKLGTTLGMGLAGILVQGSGFDVRHGGQTPEILARMTAWYIAAPLLFWGCALPAIWFFPLGRSRMKAIRGTLETRRGAL